MAEKTSEELHAEKQEAWAKQIVAIMLNAQRAAAHYSAIRISNCPSEGEEAREHWREAYPFRGEESFTVPAVTEFLRTIT